MAVVTMKNLLEAGVHFGHPAKRWDPRMKRFIFSERNGIHIVDLQKTMTAIKEVYEEVRSLVHNGKSILFVGTKKQAQHAIQREAERCGMYYVNQRWLGGMLTNFATIKKSIHRLRRLEKMENDGTFDALTKKEISKLNKERAKLEKNIGGIKDMKELPGAVFIIDTLKESIAIAEANRINIPVIAIVDTNCNPDNITHPVPGNDDAIRSILLFSQIIANAVIEADNEIGLQIEGAYEENNRVGSVAAGEKEEEKNKKSEKKEETNKIAASDTTAAADKNIKDKDGESDKQVIIDDYSNYVPEEESKGEEESADEAELLIDEDKLYPDD